MAATRHRKRPAAGWQALRRRDAPPVDPAAVVSIAAAATRAGHPVDPEELWRTHAKWSAATEHWINDTYHVVLRPVPETEGAEGMPAMIHLSIKRHDRAPVSDWRDKQRIKDQLVGPDCEAVELYPARDRVVDTANQYHLWALAEPGLTFPFGFAMGLQLDHDPAETSGAVQRPFSADAHGADRSA